MRSAAFLILGCVLCMPAAAQRPAISRDLSPGDAAAAFESALVEGCVAAVSGGKRIGAIMAEGKIAATSDAETLRQVGAGAGDMVWDVVAAKGVVTVKERDGRCEVQVYGPPAAATVMATAQKLKAGGSGFESLLSAGGGISQSLMRADDDKRIQVSIKGSEPGMPGHQSRFSVVTATVLELK